MRRKIKLGMTLILLIGVILLSRKLSQIVTNEEVTVKKPVVVIDPGHGGEDPGKVGVNGALEKDLNLLVAKRVKEKLEAQGIEVVMTREEDVMQGEKVEHATVKSQAFDENGKQVGEKNTHKLIRKGGFNGIFKGVKPLTAFTVNRNSGNTL